MEIRNLNDENKIQTDKSLNLNKKKIYIDFDGVILDTEYRLKEEYLKTDQSITYREYASLYDWNKLINESEVIADALSFIKKSKNEICLLSKMSSLSEGVLKVKYLRENNVNINICLVPVSVSKSDMVNAKGNILIDDKVYNLDEWSNKGGIGIFFNKDNEDIDIKGTKNTKYRKISDFKILLDDVDNIK